MKFFIVGIGAVKFFLGGLLLIKDRFEPGINSSWSVRELKRQIDSSLYDSTLNQTTKKEKK